jgi:hypothetical protein
MLELALKRLGEKIVGRFYSSGEKESRPVQHTTPASSGIPLMMRGFAEPQATQAQPQKFQPLDSRSGEERTQEFLNSVSKISFAPLPQVDIMARKWDERKAARAEAKLQANIQAKLAIGAVGDKYEQEADQVAAQVVQKINVPEPVQRHEEEEIQAKSLGSVQRVEEEDEELQMKPLSESIQRVEKADKDHELTHVVQQGGTVRRKSIASANISIQRLMSGKEFKEKTKVRFHRRNRIAAIDHCLKKIGQSGADSILLTELLNAIDAWLKVADDESNRKQTVEQLRSEVIEEITKISESLSNDVDFDEAPTTRNRSSAFSAEVTGLGKKYSGDFSDFDSKQFRVSGRSPNRRIEEVKRQQMQDGKVVYYAMGLVTGFNGKAPMIAPYPEPIALGDWYPKVTHINGMAVAPKTGILSAVALQESVNKALDGQNDMAVGQDAVDVLYTYSAQRGGLFADVFDCIKGKVEVKDAATEKQEEIMLDAVHRQKRVTVSAHSRGTIKTDNAVRTAHKILTNECLPAVKQKRYQEVMDYWEANDPGIGLSPQDLANISFNGFAAEEAKAEMNKFIQLIYAGNAVQHPSAFIDVSIYVGGLDPVSMFVGTYSEVGRKIDAAIGTGGSKESQVHSVGRTKGHGFTGNYIPAVSQEIAEDIKSR